MKILYHFRTQGTGAEGVHIAGIARALTQLGHEVVFSSPTGIDPRRTAGANPFTPKKRSLLARLAAQAPQWLFELLEIGYNAVAWWRNRQLLAEHGCELIYERHAFFLCSTALLGVPFVVEVNELAGDERVRAEPWLSGLAHRADAFTFARAALIVVVSPHLQRRIVAMGIPPNRILVLPNAVAEEDLDIPVEPAVIRQRLDCTKAITIGFIGWFVPWHRLDLLLEAFASIDAPHLRLLLVGDGDLRTDLADQAARLGIADRLIFTGAIPHAETPAYIAAMDVCIIPHSNDFRSPIKLFEYMARGRAILAAQTEPIAQVIRDGENGLLFQPGELGAKLRTLVADPALRARLGAQAEADLRAHHTWKHNAEAVLRAL